MTTRFGVQEEPTAAVTPRPPYPQLNQSLDVWAGRGARSAVGRLSAASRRPIRSTGTAKATAPQPPRRARDVHAETSPLHAIQQPHTAPLETNAATVLDRGLPGFRRLPVPFRPRYPAEVNMHVPAALCE